MYIVQYRYPHKRDFFADCDVAFDTKAEAQAWIDDKHDRGAVGIVYRIRKA